MDLAAKIAASASARAKIKAVVTQKMTEYTSDLVDCVNSAASGLPFSFGVAPLSPSVVCSGLRATATSGVAFNHGEAHRPSLAPDRYGGTDLIYIFNNGYQAGGRIWGYWDTAGDYIWSRPSYAGDHFVQEAAADFKSSHPDVTVRIDSSYE